MATYKSRKKSNAGFYLTLVAIVAVILAIGFIVYEESTSKSSFMENNDFATALSEVLDKRPSAITEEDLAKIGYISILKNDEESFSVAIAYDELVEKFPEYQAKYDEAEEAQNDVLAAQEAVAAAQESGDEAALKDANADLAEITANAEIIVEEVNTLGTELSALVKNANFETKNGNFDDIKYFTGAKIIEISSVEFTDSSVFAGMKDVKEATITSCGLKEVSGFAGFGTENLEYLNISGNPVEDEYAALTSFADKVVVNTYYTMVPDENGSFDQSSIQLVEQTLTEYLDELAAAEEEAEKEAETENGDENVIVEVPEDSEVDVNETTEG